MADFLSKIKLPVATEHKTHLNLSSDHVTSQDWFKLKPIWSRMLVPGQSININVGQTVRLMPLYKPFYGSGTVINRFFAVPLRTVMQGFNEFITDTVVHSASFTGIPSIVPYFTQEDLHTLVKNTASGFSEAGTSTSHDIILPVNGTATPYRFTKRGKYFVDILRCLGYQVSANTTAMTFNALPLLAFCKVYYDWFQNTNFTPSGVLARLFEGYNRHITAQDLADVFSEILFAPYANDYFTSAWDNPSAPGSSTISSSVSVNDPTNIGNPNNQSSSVQTLSNGTPIAGRSSSSGYASISQFVLTALHAVTDYMKRHQLSGFRALDRFAARFGIQLPDAKLNRSSYLGKDSNPISIGEVMSQADTEGAILGQYCGRGIGQGRNGNFSYKADEYTIVMIVSIIIPSKVCYYQGISRFNLDTDRLSFYTPEMDGLGCQAIAAGELFADQVNYANTNDTKATWAFIPRYGHYKVGQDLLTGDFRFNSINAQMKYWHLFRDFDETDIPSHDRDFCQGDNAEFDRIFNDGENTSNSDHFISYYHFDVKSVAPMSPLFENYHFDEAGFERNMKVGGTKLD